LPFERPNQCFTERDILGRHPEQLLLALEDIEQAIAVVDGMDWSRLHDRDVARPTATS
jgi:hypothetical protein